MKREVFYGEIGPLFKPSEANNPKTQYKVFEALDKYFPKGKRVMAYNPKDKMYYDYSIGDYALTDVGFEGFHLYGVDGVVPIQDILIDFEPGGIPIQCFKAFI